MVGVVDPAAESKVPFRIQMFFNEQPLSIGTGFTYQSGDRIYLVTNWHNVSGRHAETKEALSKTKALPNRMQFKVLKIEPAPDLGPNGMLMRWEPATVPLYDDEEHRVPLWMEHPEHRSGVDVIALEATNAFAGSNVIPVNSEELSGWHVPNYVSADALVLGYPRGLSGGANFPIWKRASIASEPSIDLDGVPKLLIDTATREGMSGAPTFVRAVGLISREPGKLAGDSFFGTKLRFIGVYSGRLGDDAMSAQLGIVWKEHAIKEIIDGGVRGISSFEL
ncbi:hypothetical protein [Paraburkholderia bannensis]|uniref:hypothetical protein n=1 Tax=Paraburkholderia bannensis TaxID=765414 RepID=UPI002AB77C46|nr:hypothetical protein [Paraburkholderia bannensis]